MKPLNRFWTIFIVVSNGLLFTILFWFGVVQSIYSHILPEGPSSCTNSVTFRSENLTNLSRPLIVKSSDHSDEWRFDAERDGKNYGLTDDQCDAAFPGLFEDINTSVERQKKKGSLTVQDIDATSRLPNTTRAMIYDNELFILDTTERNPPGRPFATLLSLHRALTAFPGKLPNVEFQFSTLDKEPGSENIWVSSRRAQDEGWIMPDFNFWSWAEPHVGGYSEVLRRMDRVEEVAGPFKDKTPKLVWRGNSKTAPRLRNDLIAQTQGKSWADVLGMSWKSDEIADTMIPIEDLCVYQFIAGTEGYAYSGRLKYILNCNSIVLTHKMQWIQPFEYLLVSEGDLQNYIEVERDWSDLDEKMSYYLSHPEEAEHIANNARRTFRERYLTPAAEACYWRKLIQGWSKVSFEPDFYKEKGKGKHGERGWRGVPFESYILTRQLEWPIA